VSQKPGPEEIIIVDSSTTEDTEKVVKLFKKKLTIKYLFESKTGYPTAYNSGVILVKGTYIAFLNDDCTVTKNWYKNICDEIVNHPHEILQGKVLHLPTNNIYAEIMGEHYVNWIALHSLTEQRMDTFDAKCTIMPKNLFYLKGKFKGFDERLIKGSEDIEFGQRLYHSGITIRYCPSILITHTERTNLKDFIKQHYRIAQAESTLTKITRYGKVVLFPPTKTKRNMQSLLKRVLKNLRRFEIDQVFYAVFLYSLMFFIRLYGYNKAKWLN
jgi:GT2 family glycosyltransferase